MRAMALLLMAITACGAEPQRPTCRPGEHSVELIGVEDGCGWGEVDWSGATLDVAECGAFDEEATFAGAGDAYGCDVTVAISWIADAPTFGATVSEAWRCADRTCGRTFEISLEASR